MPTEDQLQQIAAFESERDDVARRLSDVQQRLAVKRMEYRKVRAQLEAWETIVAFKRAQQGGGDAVR